MTEELVALGVIGGAHGIKGQVKIKSFTACAEDLASYGHLQDKSGRVYDITIASTTKDTVIASIDGINSRNEAELLRNQELYVLRSCLPKLENDEYYYADLIQMQVLSEDNALYGTILAVTNYGAGDIAEIALATDGTSVLLPFTKATFPIINTKNRTIIINLPEVIS